MFDFPWLFGFEVACCVYLLFSVLALAYGLRFVFVGCMFVGWFCGCGLVYCISWAVVWLGCLLLIGLFRRMVGGCVLAVVFAVYCCWVVLLLLADFCDWFWVSVWFDFGLLHFVVAMGLISIEVVERVGFTVASITALVSCLLLAYAVWFWFVVGLVGCL